MSARFADAALRLCPLAARALGWPPDTFWRATPADLANALGPPPGDGAPLTRPEFERLMEHDRHGHAG